MWPRENQVSKRSLRSVGSIPQSRVTLPSNRLDQNRPVWCWSGDHEYSKGRSSTLAPGAPAHRSHLLDASRSYKFVGQRVTSQSQQHILARWFASPHSLLQDTLRQSELFWPCEQPATVQQGAFSSSSQSGLSMHPGLSSLSESYRLPGRSVIRQLVVLSSPSQFAHSNLLGLSRRFEFCWHRSLGLDQAKRSFLEYPGQQSLLLLGTQKPFSRSWLLDLSSTSKLVSSSRLEHGVPVQPRPSHSYSSFSWPTSVSRLEAEPSSARLSGYHQPQSQDMSKLPWSSSPSNANQARYMFFKSSPLAGTQPLSLLSEPSKLLASGVQLETSSKAKQSRSGASAETHGLLLLDYLGIFSQSWLIHLDAIGKRSVSKSLATIQYAQWQALQASHQYAQFSHYWRLALGVIRSTRARSLESNGLALRVVILQYTRSKWSLLSSVCVSYLRQLLFSATWFAPLESQPLLKVVYTSQLLGGIGDEG